MEQLEQVPATLTLFEDRLTVAVIDSTDPDLSQCHTLPFSDLKYEEFPSKPCTLTFVSNNATITLTLDSTDHARALHQLNQLIDHDEQ